LTQPNTLRQRSIRSKLPSADFACAKMLSAHHLAATVATSIETCCPTCPICSPATFPSGP
jgi:hypothetical protein